MKLARRMLVLGVAAALSTPAVLPAQQQQLLWKEGHVINASFVRTKPGKFNDYMRYIMGPYRQIQEGLKQAGVIVDWSVATAPTQTPDDPDIILYTTYANMAALDNLTERSDAVLQRVQGSLQQRDQMTVDREALRTVVGSRLIRVLVPR